MQRIFFSHGLIGVFQYQDLEGCEMSVIGDAGFYERIICIYSQKMGQILPSDKTGQLCLEPPAINVSETKKYTPLLLAKGVESPFLEKVFQYENYKRLEVTYKYLPDGYVHLQLTKEKAKQEPGYPLGLGNEMVYGYKFKKNEKTEKIRPDKIYFRRKIYIPSHEPNAAKTAYRDKLKNNLRHRSRTREEESKRRESRTKSKGKEPEQKKNYQAHKEDLLRKLAQLKLFSKMDLGIKLGRMVDGSDGVLTEHYVQFYSEVAISRCSFEEREAGEREKLCETLQKKGFRTNKQTVNIAYSVFQKGYILKQTAVPPRQSDENEDRSIKFIVREFEDELNKAILKLDGLSNMMTAIQNHLSQRDVDKAMEKFEENMAAMEDSDRLMYAEQMAFLLGKYSSYKSYEREVSSYISTSRSSSMAESRNLSQSRFNARSLKSDHPEDSSSTDLEGVMRFSLNRDEIEIKSPTTSPRSNAPLRFSDSESTNRAFLSSPQQEHSVEGVGRGIYAESNYIMWESAQERLRNSILDNDKSGISESLTCLKNLGVLSHLEVEVYFGQLLMENAKTKHAKIIFERILHTKKGGGHDFLKSEIYSMLGFLAYCDGRLVEALSNYEKCLTIKFKLRNYSRKTLLTFNNMAAICYSLEKYDKCLLYLHRGMRLGEYCADYELLMRSNYAMALAEQGQLKEAKLEMYKTYRNVEPYSNNEIVCKFYSNLGYFDLVDNLPEKAKASLDLACQIEEKFLIPNGYKFSLILHNNYAMYHYKKSQWKRAATHLKKIEGQLNDIHGLRAVQIHFNFGKVYKELDNFDSAIKHFSEARGLLLKMEEKYIVKYRQKIEQEMDKIEAQRIIEVSEESSYANKLSRISRSMISQKAIQSKIWA